MLVESPPGPTKRPVSHAPVSTARRWIAAGATVMTTCRQPGGVTVIDIACPACGRSDSTRKERIGTYTCTACGHEFDHGDLDVVEQSESP